MERNGRRRVRSSSGERAYARELREEGHSIGEIARQLGRPTSTVGAWVRDVLVDADLRNALVDAGASVQDLRGMSATARRRRETERVVAAARDEIGRLTDRELWLAGVVAYWCEGTKQKPWATARRVAFINSDPDLVALFVRWSADVGIPRADLCFRLLIHETADVPAAHRFWSGVLGVPIGQFDRPTLKRHKPKTARESPHEPYRGCVIVTVRRSTDLNRQIAAWFEGVAQALAWDRG